MARITCACKTWQELRAKRGKIFAKFCAHARDYRFSLSARAIFATFAARAILATFCARNLRFGRFGCICFVFVSFLFWFVFLFFRFSFVFLSFFFRFSFVFLSFPFLFCFCFLAGCENTARIILTYPFRFCLVGLVVSAADLETFILKVARSNPAGFRGKLLIC